MKKTKILSLVSLGAFLLTTSGCTDYDFVSKYEDPSKVTQVTISNLMVGVFQKVKDYDVYEYNRFFGFDSQFTGKYAQTFGYSNTTDMYTPGYIPENVHCGGEKIVQLYFGGKIECLILCLLCRAFFFVERFQLAELGQCRIHIVPLSVNGGYMPFSEACMLPLTNDVGKSYAHYDKAENIYKTILDELKEIAPRFRSIPTPRNFNTQDFINNGDMDKWERYANSLRLRLAMRVAAQGDLQTEGRTAIKEILENPSAYPLIEEQENNILIVNQKSGQLNFTAGHGLGDWVTNRLASGAIIDRMLGHGNYDMTCNDPLSGVYVKGEDDPRILLNFNPVKITNQNTGQLDEHRYLGTDLTVADELTEYYNSQAQDEVNTSNTGFSQITQKGFFWENDKFDMLIMASPEIHFLKAEAYEMGYGVAKNEEKRKKSSKRLSANPSRFTTITTR